MTFSQASISLRALLASVAMKRHLWTLSLLASVNAAGAIRQVVRGEDSARRRYLVIAEGRRDRPGPAVQVQLK
jgi:hypothetical protein